VSILNSLYTGASGMTAHGGAIGIVGDNIANVSTIGYKRSRADFADVLGGTLGGQRLGAGVRLGGPDQLFDQGSLQQTGGALDLAIRGEGLFVVKGAHDGQDRSYYTRDGRFGLDENGMVVDSHGLRLQGYTIDATGTAATSASDLDLAGQESPPVATTKANLSFHLDPSEPVVAWDPANPAGTSSHQTSITVRDSLGNSHQVDMYFCKTADGQWDWHAMADGGELAGGAAGTATEIASGKLAFDGNGALTSETPGASSASFVGATANQTIAFDFGDAIADGGTGRGGTTQTAGGFDVAGLDVDGRPPGKLIDVQVNDDGTVVGMYDNGDTHDVARVALALFASEAELTRNGDGLYSQSSASGEPLVGAAGVGGRGAITSGALESSNVDLGAELVTMIAYQRAFQANVKTVTTADEMLAEVAQIKR
jgi:flagellar hook protein FlgE